MLADAVAWVCRSPRRLAVFAVALMAVILIGSNLLGSTEGSASDQGSGADPAPTSAQVPDAGSFVQTAVTFTRAWSQLEDGETVQQWQATLQPLTTPDLAQALSSTDPASLPGAAPQGDPVVRFVSQGSALIAVPLANGSSVLVTVVADGPAQRVSDVQPFAGDN